jgi:hypothetical protein
MFDLIYFVKNDKIQNKIKFHLQSNLFGRRKSNRRVLLNVTIFGKHGNTKVGGGWEIKHFV